jgi:hypothetical protein
MPKSNRSRHLSGNSKQVLQENGTDCAVELNQERLFGKNDYSVISLSCRFFCCVVCCCHTLSLVQVRSRLETPDHWVTYCEVTDGQVTKSGTKTEVHRRKVANYY